MSGPNRVLLVTLKMIPTAAGTWEYGRMSWPLTGAAYYHVQLGLPVKCCVIKGLVVNWLLLNLNNGLLIMASHYKQMMDLSRLSLEI